MISIGNKADLDEVDFIRPGGGPGTKVIAGYLESIKEGEKFLPGAEDAAGVKPVVILKVGITKAGVKAASSHTGSLAGADIAYGAAFKRAGVIRAENFEALFDSAMAFAMQPMPRGTAWPSSRTRAARGSSRRTRRKALGLSTVAPTPGSAEALKQAAGGGSVRQSD